MSDATYVCEKSDSFICVTRLIHVCHMCDVIWFGPTVYIIVNDDPCDATNAWLVCNTQLILMCDVTPPHDSCVQHNSFVTPPSWLVAPPSWLGCKAQPHSYVWCDSSTGIPLWYEHTVYNIVDDLCDITDTWLVRVRDMNDSYVWHEPFSIYHRILWIATVSRIDKIISLFFRISSLL